MGEKSLQRSLVLRHCCSGLCPCRFPRHILPVKTCFIYFVNLILHPSFLQPPLQTKAFTTSVLHHKTRKPTLGPWGMLGRVCGGQGAALWAVQAAQGSAAGGAVGWGGPGRHLVAAQASPGLQERALYPSSCCTWAGPRQFTSSASPSSGLHVLQHRGCLSVSRTQMF